jgi:hypothetical protein
VSVLLFLTGPGFLRVRVVLRWRRRFGVYSSSSVEAIRARAFSVAFRERLVGTGNFSSVAVVGASSST